MPKRFEVRLDVDGEVTDVRLARDEEEAGKFSVSDVEDAIKEGLRSKLSGGESNFDVEVAQVREVDY